MLILSNCYLLACVSECCSKLACSFRVCLKINRRAIFEHATCGAGGRGRASSTSKQVCLMSMLVSISRSQQVKCACTISRKMSRWGDEKTLKFVILYRNNECLWNPRIPQYKNNVERNNAYEDLLTNMEDPSLTVKIIKTKIKNLRSAYHAELKKVENSKRSGSGAATVYKPSAAWFDEMNSFLGDTSEYREPIEVVSFSF